MLTIFLSVVFYLFTQIEQSSQAQNEPVLASRTISLGERYPNPFVNEIFKENILLNLAYMRGVVDPSKKVDWLKVTEPFTYSMLLKPGEVFAFHDDVTPEFEQENIKTSNAHFNSSEGFKSDGYLVGDGVCHLASLIYWAAKSAGIESLAPTRHDFANIPQVPREYGVSIYATPGKNDGDDRQNLYIKNDREKTIAFVFTYQENNLQVTVKEQL